MEQQRIEGWFGLASDDKTSLKLLYGEAFLAQLSRFTYEHYGSFAFKTMRIYQSFYAYSQCRSET